MWDITFLPYLNAQTLAIWTAVGEDILEISSPLGGSLNPTPLGPVRSVKRANCLQIAAVAAAASSSSSLSMAKQLIPLLNRVLVEKIVRPSKTSAGILLPEKTNKLNSGKVIAVGPGVWTRDGKLIPVFVKEGDTILLPEYGGTEVKLGDKVYHLFRDDDILGSLHD